MIDFKSFIFYFVLSLLTFSGIWLSGSYNFMEYISGGLIPSFTNNTYTEFGNFIKVLNSTHCIEKIKNAGGEIEISISSNYYRIDQRLPNMTSIVEVENMKLKNLIKTLNISCEKIEDEGGWLIKVRNKYGILEFGFINGSYYENIEGMVSKLNWKNAGSICQNLFNAQAKIIQEIINVSSCFNRDRIS